MHMFVSIAVISLLGAMSPGPDFAIVSQNAMRYSRMAGLMSAIGIGLGIIIHSTYCILGIAIIIAHSAIAYKVISILGASYLIYLGVKGIFSSKKSSKEIIAEKNEQISSLTALKQGFLVNVLNPKCMFFMISVFTIVVKPHTPYWVQSIYGLELSGIAVLWFMLVAYLFTHAQVQKRIDRIQFMVIKVLGVFLIGFGLELIVRMFLKHVM